MRDLINILTTLAEAEIQPPAPELNYATQDDYKTLIPALTAWLVKVGVHNPVPEISKKAGRVLLIRMSNVTPAQLKLAAQGLGLTEDNELSDIQQISSGQFSIHSYSARGVTFTFVLRGVKTAASFAGNDGSMVLNRKDLTPTKLGLAGDYDDRRGLEKAVIAALKSNVKNEKLASALIELVALAVNRGEGQLKPESLQYIKPFRGMISQDFGEILAPIALAKDGEKINFPVGNEKLIDVTVGGNIRYSVKALGGSGTSMNSLGTLLDDYALTITDAGKKQKFENGIKIWQSTRKEGSVTDRICLAAKLNGVPEYFSYVDILGGEFDNWAELKKLLKPLVNKLDYRGFLEMILPATQAGNWGQDVGMPVDANYNLGLTDIKPKAGIAGKPSYEADPVDGAANIITYCLGKGIEYMIRRGPDRQQYKDIMNDMIKQMNCQLGHVNIDEQGQLVVTSKPFGNLDFEFDYHAPSNIAGNNRPGFLIVPPNKDGKKDKAKSKDDPVAVSAPTVKPKSMTGGRIDIKNPNAERSAAKFDKKKDSVGRAERQ